MKIWALLGAHQGDNNQVLALAEALGLPFERKCLTYNRWRHLQPRFLGATFRSLTRESREQVSGDLPDLTISTGHRSVPVVQALRRRSGGRMLSVHIGYPRISPGQFDLVVATPEYPIPNHPHVLRTPLALSRASQLRPDIQDKKLLDRFARPRHLLIVGGPTLFWRPTKRRVASIIEELVAEADANGGSVWVVGSPRTPTALFNAMKRRLARAKVSNLVVNGQGPPSYPALLSEADRILVTADSVAMISEAILSRKPVRLVPIRRSPLGVIHMEVMDRLRPGRQVYPRDLRYFWAALNDHGYLQGEERLPLTPIVNPTAEVVQRVNDLLDRSRRTPSSI